MEGSHTKLRLMLGSTNSPPDPTLSPFMEKRGQKSHTIMLNFTILDATHRILLLQVKFISLIQTNGLFEAKSVLKSITCQSVSLVESIFWPGWILLRGDAPEKQLICWLDEQVGSQIQTELNPEGSTDVWRVWNAPCLWQVYLEVWLLVHLMAADCRGNVSPLHAAPQQVNAMKAISSNVPMSSSITVAVNGETAAENRRTTKTTQWKRLRKGSRASGLTRVCSQKHSEPQQQNISWSAKTHGTHWDHLVKMSHSENHTVVFFTTNLHDFIIVACFYNMLKNCRVLSTQSTMAQEHSWDLPHFGLKHTFISFQL